MSPLTRSVGPECPECGCEACVPRGDPHAWGRQTLQRYRCGHCGQEFSAAPPEDQDGVEAEEPVVHSVSQAEHCGQPMEVRKSKKARIAGTWFRVKYWRCRVCGKPFKTADPTAGQRK